MLVTNCIRLVRVTINCSQLAEFWIHVPLARPKCKLYDKRNFSTAIGTLTYQHTHIQFSLPASQHQREKKGSLWQRCLPQAHKPYLLLSDSREIP